MINVHVRGPEGTKGVGTIPSFDRVFYDRVPVGTSKTMLWGLPVKLDWRGGYGKIVGILVKSSDVPKLIGVGFKPV